MHRSYIYIYILIHLIFHFKHDVLITEKPLRGVFNKVLLLLTYFVASELHCLTRGRTSDCARDRTNLDVIVIFKPVFHVAKKLEDVQPVEACVEKCVHTFKRGLMIKKRRLDHLSSFSSKYPKSLIYVTSTKPCIDLALF